MKRTPSSSPENGATLVEVLVTTLLLAIVFGAVLVLLDTLARTERRSSASVNNQDEVRAAMTQFGREVRGANPLLRLTSVTNYQNSVMLRLGDTTVGAIQYVRWSFDPATSQVIRQTLSGDTPTSSVTGTRVVLRNVRNSSMTPPLPFLRYYDVVGNQLSTTANTTRDFVRCARRITIAVAADPQKGGADPFVRQTEVQLRNSTAGGGSC